MENYANSEAARKAQPNTHTPKQYHIEVYSLSQFENEKMDLFVEHETIAFPHSPLQLNVRASLKSK